MYRIDILEIINCLGQQYQGNILSKKLFWKIILARENERNEKD